MERPPGVDIDGRLRRVPHRRGLSEFGPSGNGVWLAGNIGRMVLAIGRHRRLHGAIGANAACELAPSRTGHAGVIDNDGTSTRGASVPRFYVERPQFIFRWPGPRARRNRHRRLLLRNHICAFSCEPIYRLLLAALRCRIGARRAASLFRQQFASGSRPSGVQHLRR